MMVIYHIEGICYCYFLQGTVDIYRNYIISNDVRSKITNIWEKIADKLVLHNLDYIINILTTKLLFSQYIINYLIVSVHTVQKESNLICYWKVWFINWKPKVVQECYTNDKFEWLIVYFWVEYNDKLEYLYAHTILELMKVQWFMAYHFYEINLVDPVLTAIKNWAIILVKFVASGLLINAFNFS